MKEGGKEARNVSFMFFPKEVGWGDRVRLVVSCGVQDVCLWAGRCQGPYGASLRSEC